MVTPDMEVRLRRLSPIEAAFPFILQISTTVSSFRHLPAPPT